MLPAKEFMELCKDRWHGILPRVGIPAEFLKKTHGPCPMCGGKDRFRFDNKEGRGTWYCNQCGSGDGMSLLMKFNDWTYTQCYRAISPIVGHIDPVTEKPRTVEGNRESLNRVWRESFPILKGDPVDVYLTRRGVGLDRYPTVLRYHRELGYYENKKKTGTYAAMIARIVTEGKPATLHRTYLLNGLKAPVASAKKIMSPVRTIKGGAVPLFPAIDTLAVTEGIETALAVHKHFALPVWAAISEGGMQALVVPETVKEVLIFADNDASGVGQKAAQILASRMLEQGRRIEIHIPTTTGNDWLDECTDKGKEGIRG
jgi:putative DNA primase/helicase